MLSAYRGLVALELIVWIVANSTSTRRAPAGTGPDAMRNQKGTSLAPAPDPAVEPALAICEAASASGGLYSLALNSSPSVSKKLATILK